MIQCRLTAGSVALTGLQPGGEETRLFPPGNGTGEAASAIPWLVSGDVRKKESFLWRAAKMDSSTSSPVRRGWGAGFA